LSRTFISLQALEVASTQGSTTGPRGELPYLLITPPLTDPTSPYHSISYLAGATSAAGFTDFRCLDANIAALNQAAEPETVAALLAAAADVRRRLERKRELSRREELQYRMALGAVGLTASSVVEALNVFRNARDFYDYGKYRAAVGVAGRWINLLSLRGFPGSFDGFALRTQGFVNLASHEDLTDSVVLDQLAAPFASYIDGAFVQTLKATPWRLIGFSVNYISQLPFALVMARTVRRECPDATIVFGGTEVCDDIKFATEPARIWQLFPHADVLVAGEGETALVGILAALADDTDAADVPGVLARHRPTIRPEAVYEDLATLPAPRYDIWPWEDYWSPEPVVLYSPTRGCYWNKCTFCDYGLNSDRPTSPSRERPTHLLRRDLEHLRTTARTVYFAVDAMSPRFLKRLSEVLEDAELGLQWSAELRLERTFPKRELAQHLRRGGCVAISFGYESASQRILDLIDKGVQIADVPAILHELKSSGIGVQMMGFTGFPTETPAEAVETYEFLLRHDDYWTIAGIGSFVLTGGSMVAKQPSRFGIEVLPDATSDIQRFVPWRETRDGPMRLPGQDEAPVPAHLRRQIVRVRDDRPFVGGIDSAHSILYFGRFGRRLVPDELASTSVGAFTIYETPFVRPWAFTSPSDLEQQHASLHGRDGRVTQLALRAWLDERRPVPRSANATLVELHPDGGCTPHVQHPALRALTDLLSRSG
jgi:anaerobic magnesium-protoporphyrin IX monomethyl ester cyclase